jgi:uncharacterized repeat protein (TIGR01451 family)
MRKNWWLPVICIAACVPQVLLAVDTQDAATQPNPASGRSRLLIYSRKKTPPPDQDLEQDEDAPRPASARLSRSPANDTKSPVRKPSGNTGTFSPKSGTARLGVSQPADQAAGDDSEVGDDDIRRMFEEESAAKLSAKRPAIRPAASRSEETNVEMPRSAAASDIEPVNSQARRSARYQELLGGTSTATDRAAVTQDKKKILPVSTESDDQQDLEINPFEPSERPTKVVNAGFEEEKGNTGTHRVKQASATTAGKLTVSEKAVAEKTAADKSEVSVRGDKSEKTASVVAATTKGTSVKPVSAVKSLDTAKAKVLEIGKPAAKSTVTRDQFEATAVKPASVVTTAASTASFGSGANHYSPQVDVQWEPRGEVTLGQECKCALVVHNSGKVAACEVIVEANFPESVRLVDAKPFPKEASQRLQWHFGTLAAGEKKVIELMIVPTKRGELAASAQVRFTGTAATSFQVSEPLLTASVKVAEEVHLGDPASATVTISNPGTGTAQNVVVSALLPAGLSSTSGKEIITELGPIGAGETRTMRLALIATAGGDQILKVIAKSSTAELEHTAVAKIVVLAPSLTLKASGPSLRYVNRAAKYQLTVTNNSNAASDNVRVSQKVQTGFDFAKADHGGQWDSQGRTVSWYLGHLDAGQSTVVELELMPKETGEFHQHFRVVGDSGAQATAEVATRVEGAASLVMEVKDGDDPVEVGTETAFEVRVRNDGSKSAHKVAISLELPPDVELVNVDGPTKHLFESGMLIFKPLAELAAGDSATFKVYIKGTASGATKLRARLTSESIQKPLIVEEATQFYEE